MGGGGRWSVNSGLLYAEPRINKFVKPLFTQIEKNNCISIYIRSGLNKIREEIHACPTGIICQDLFIYIRFDLHTPNCNKVIEKSKKQKAKSQIGIN